MNISTEALCIGVVIVFVVILLMYMAYNNKYGNDYLYGMWEADKEFSEEAGMTAIMVMMGPSQGGYWNDHRKMYVLMYNEDEAVINQTVDVELGPTWTMTGEYQNRSIHILDSDFDHMPSEMTMSVSVKNGHMVFYGTGDDSKTIYLSVYKDHDSTHKAKLLEQMAAANSNGDDKSHESDETNQDDEC